MAEVKKTVSTAKTDITTPASAVKTTAAESAAEPKATDAKKAEPKAAAAKKAEPKAAAAKKTTTKKAEPKTAAAKKTAAKKAEPKTAAKKRAGKAAAPDSAVYIQFNDMSVSSDGLVARVKEIWKEKKNKVSDLKDIKVYVNVAESRAYYVVNENHFGAFDL